MAWELSYHHSSLSHLAANSCAVQTLIVASGLLSAIEHCSGRYAVCLVPNIQQCSQPLPGPGANFASALCILLVSCFVVMWFHLASIHQGASMVQGGLVAQPSGGSWGRPGSPGSRPGTAGSYRGGEAPPSPTKLATLQQTSFNKANSGALSEVSCSCKCHAVVPSSLLQIRTVWCLKLHQSSCLCACMHAMPTSIQANACMLCRIASLAILQP